MKRYAFSPRVCLALSAAVLVVAAGCGGSPAGNPAKARAAFSPPAPAWDWERYPLVSRMRLGTLPCQLQPRSSMVVHSPIQSTLRVYIDAPETNLPAGHLWAEFEPEMFAAEEKALAEAGKRLDDREKVQWEIDLPRKRLQLERQLEEAQRVLAYQRLLATNKEYAEVAFSIGLPGGAPLRPDSLDKSELELRLLAQTMDFIQETNLTALGFDLGAQRLDLERRSLDYKRRKEQSQFRMPFDARLTLNLPLTEGVTEYQVASGQEIATVRDFSSVRLRVPLANASWSSIPGEKLSATVRLPSGEGVEAAFAFQKIERNQNREESVYYFQFAPEKAAMAARLIGANVSCEIWVNLDEPARVVPKLSLVLYQPEAFQNRSWSFAVASLFPGARLAAEGQTDIGIVLGRPVTVSQATP